MSKKEKVPIMHRVKTKDGRIVEVPDEKLDEYLKVDGNKKIPDEKAMDEGNIKPPKRKKVDFCAICGKKTEETKWDTVRKHLLKDHKIKVS